MELEKLFNLISKDSGTNLRIPLDRNGATALVLQLLDGYLVHPLDVTKVLDGLLSVRCFFTNFIVFNVNVI